MLKPEASADGLAMHLAIPANIAANHMLTFDPARYLWAVMPMGADFTYAIVYLLGGEMAARLLNFAILLVLLGLLHAAVRRWVSPGVAWLLVTLFATTPMVQLVTGSLFVENLLAAFLLGMMTALWRFGESGERRSLYLAAALGGTAMATKFGAIVILAPALVCAAAEVWRHRKQTGARWALAAGLLLLAAAPPYAIAWIKTGNPVFPFANDSFHSRQLDPKAGSDERFPNPLTWKTPYDLTFRTTRYYEGQYGSFGFQYLVLAPLALLALLVAPRRQAVSAAVVASSAILLILGTQPNARYLYPALPLLFVPFAALLGWAAAHQRLLARALLAFAIACAADQCLFPPRLQLLPQGSLRTVHAAPARSLHRRDRAHSQRDRMVQPRPSASRRAADPGQRHRRPRRRRLRKPLASVQHPGPDPPRAGCAAAYTDCWTDGTCAT